MKGELEKRFKAFSAGWTRVHGKLIRKNDYVDLVLNEARKELLAHAEVTECCEPDGSETPIIIIDLETWFKWFGDGKNE